MKDNLKYKKLWSLDVRHIQEDKVLEDYVELYGRKNWKKIAKKLTLQISSKRTAKQCRERWENKIKFQHAPCFWSEAEEKLLFSLHMTFGNKWAIISKYFPGKSSNSIKNNFYSTIRRNIRRYNKGKNHDMQLKGPINKLIKVPEFREILTTSKKVGKEYFLSVKLPFESFAFLDKETNFEKDLQAENEISNDDLELFLAFDDESFPRFEVNRYEIEEFS
ncbi:hypothetical protein SteCoe_14939 [Stentor coeruleus]|uniref:Myb-like DNA-binding domain containing protein n=1 Tax=Stentor coeruleus TaxID=5963 RepID=A0A1R2C4S9_9CILI|nr:hypothetical protein SteCoe_14939 [Stentor coeruleus]